MYYTFAKAFGWTPEQVEELEDATARELLIILDEMQREEERAMKRK